MPLPVPAGPDIKKARRNFADVRNVLRPRADEIQDVAPRGAARAEIQVHPAGNERGTSERSSRQVSVSSPLGFISPMDIIYLRTRTWHITPL